MIAFIRDISIFESRFHTPPDHSSRRSSILESNRTLLEDWETVDSLDLSSIRCFLKCFQVPKSNVVEDRFIIDGTPLNRCSLKPPEMHLPRLHTVLEGVSHCLYAFTVDAVSYFYQFEVCPEIRKYFGLAFNRRRGRAFLRRFARMPMGWLNSPCIGQRTSLALLRELKARCAKIGITDYFSTVWLDNFIFAGNNLAELEIICRIFLEVCLEASVQLHPPTPISSEVSILGFLVQTLTSNTRTNGRTR